MRHGPITFEYDRITPHIYIGTNLCCKGHFQNELVRKGIRADISLEDEHLDEPYGAEMFLWLPTRNHRAPSQDQLLLGVRMLRECAKRGIKCYVHCERGHGRAPTLVAAYLVSTGMSVDEAVAFIKRKRPVVHPNKTQRTAIARLRKRLLQLA